MKSLNEVQKILIAVEDSKYSDNAAKYGFDLAVKLGAQVALVHVNDIPVAVPYSGDPLLNEQQPMLVPELIHMQEDSGNKLLNRIAADHLTETTVYTFQKTGDTRDEILNTAEEWNADMIILGTHGRTGFDHFISGSIAEKIIRKAKCPVLVIPNKDYASNS